MPAVVAGLANSVYHKSMTALASVCTKEGFAIGADSLRMDLHGVVTEVAVKIYETGHPDFVGAYGFTGITAFEFADDRPMLDMLESAKEVASDLLGQHFNSAEEYADGFCSKLAANIQARSTGIAIPNHFQLSGMFCGYSSGEAVYIRMEFPALVGYLLRPICQHVFHNPVDRFFIPSGSAVVLKEMSEQVCGPETLREAVNWLQDYITRCIKNDTDPYCAQIGGTAQVATVTPDQGFRWVVHP